MSGVDITMGTTNALKGSKHQIRKRQSKNLGPFERHALLHEYIKIKSNQSRKDVYGKIKKLCSRYGVASNYARRLAQKANIQVNMQRISLEEKPRPGRPRKVDSTFPFRLKAASEKFHHEFTFEELATEIEDLSPTTLWRELKRLGWREVRRLSKPRLKKEQIEKRVSWANANRTNKWSNHVDVDEKWFITKQLGRKIKVGPDEKLDPDYPRHKSHVPQVMFIAAVARPRPRFGFDGRVGLWRVAVPYVAQRSSKSIMQGKSMNEIANLTLRSSRSL